MDVPDNICAPCKEKEPGCIEPFRVRTYRMPQPPIPSPPSSKIYEKLFMVPEPTTKVSGYSNQPTPEPEDNSQDADDNTTNNSLMKKRSGRASSGEQEECEETEKQKQKRILKQLSLGPVGTASGSGFLVSSTHWMAAGHTQQWPFKSRLQCRLVKGDFRTDAASRCRHSMCWTQSRTPVGLVLQTVPYKPPSKFA